MLECILTICSIYGLAFAIREADGPWDLIAKWRNWMMRLPLVGVQFYKLLDCYYCTGWYAGLAIYFLTRQSYQFIGALEMGLTGGVVCLIFDGVLKRLHRE